MIHIKERKTSDYVEDDDMFVPTRHITIYNEKMRGAPEFPPFHLKVLNVPLETSSTHSIVLVPESVYGASVMTHKQLLVFRAVEQLNGTASVKAISESIQMSRDDVNNALRRLLRLERVRKSGYGLYEVPEGAESV